MARHLSRGAAAGGGAGLDFSFSPFRGISGVMKRGNAEGACSSGEGQEVRERL